jgi:hypothetical protein
MAYDGRNLREKVRAAARVGQLAEVAGRSEGFAAWSGEEASAFGGTRIRKGLQRADAIDDALEGERPEGAWLH